MINIYEVIDRRLTNISSIKKGSWIDLTNPTLEELEKVIQNTEINKEIITKLLDEEELPRIEKRKEETVIILDTPYVADNNKHKYRTNPLGIIISEKGYLITVSLKEQPFLDYFKQNEVNNLRGKNKTSFILQIFTMVAGIYQKELTNINKYIDSREKILSKSTNNKELIHLLDIEKTLVYFINSLKANEIALEKIAKGTIIPVEKEDEELLEDALIENKQAIEMATIYREILSSMTDTYATIISNNLNDVMKFLAGITIVFSIPTMVASFIGMNVPLGKVGSSSFSFILIILLSLLLSLLIAFILKKNIIKTISKLKEIKLKDHTLDYIVINDGSTDQTKKVCKENKINMIDLPFNLGIGGAVQTGYKYAYYNNYDIAIQYDGDGQHDGNYIKDLIEEIKKGNNIVIGSRFVSELSTFKSSKMRRLGKEILSILIKIFTGKKIYDPTSGFRAADKEIIKLFANDYPSDYPEPDTIVSVIKKGYKVSEVPVKMNERENGKSSINPLKAVYYMIKVSLAIIVAGASTKKERKDEQ